MKELESSLFGEIKMATYSIRRCHGSFVCRSKGGRNIVYKMQPDVIRQSVLYFKFGNKVFHNIELEVSASSSRIVHFNTVLLNWNQMLIISVIL